MKRYLFIVVILGCVTQGWGQITKQDLYKTLNSKKFKVSDDIYNPINFTKISERMPYENGKVKKSIWNPWASLLYIKKGSNIHIDFDKDFIDTLGDECDIQILAHIQRKDKSIKPLSVSGFTKVVQMDENINELKQNALELSSSTKVSYMYTVIKERTNSPSYSGEIYLAEEDINEEDKIILQIQNAKKNHTGFSQTFIYDDFGWKNNPTGGFSFVKIAKSNFTEFLPAASLGYSFRYQPRKSSSFLCHFLSPNFGPMMHVFQNGVDTTIGASIYISTFYNMVNIGFGSTINGVNHGKPYFSIGLNFIESYNTISNLTK